MDSSYFLIEEPPPLDDYLRLRRDSGLQPKTAAQGAPALANSWSFCHVRTTSGEVVGMGRVIGDGGWYFLIADMATDPAHQRKGVGRAVIEWLIADIERRAPAGALVSLMADPPGVRLYESVGLRDAAPSKAMWMLTDE